MNNNESVVFAGLSTLIRNNVLGPIVNFLGATKNCQVTVDELASVLKLNSTTAPMAGPMMAAPQMSGFGPQLSFGGAAPIGYPPVTNAPPSLTTFGGVPMPLASTTKSGRAPKAAENVPENEKCQYKITRGRNKDQRCQSRAEPGIPFCKLCKDKKAAASQQAQTGGAPTSNVDAPGPSFPGVQGLPQFGAGMFPGNFPAFAPSGMNQLNPVIGNALAAPEALKIKAQQLANGLLHEINHNLLIRSTAPNEYICLGIYDPKTGGNMPLTPEKIEICKSLKMNYVDPASSNVSGQSLPSINQQLPATLSVASGLPQFGLPQVPGLGMMNGAMSVTDIRGADDPDYGDDDEGSDDE